ncbi:hypothetical protein HNY73_002668 [Argiope bruennichi]|uniref:Uncharacterized protein n=1 Tax=Argiope bruennichi TaxID=94029 RepID=A0A8T0FWT3_ARGBR|nr:hypothetical protein HNY73_002668 [Argiope bruennichi]
MTSNISKTSYDLNTRLVYAFRCIGKSKTAARTFCAVMNLPPPPAKFERFNNSLSAALEKGINTLKIGVMDAVLCFSDGVSSRIEVLKDLGIAPGRNTFDALKTIDILRIKEAEIMHQKVSKEARTLKT